MQEITFRTCVEFDLSTVQKLVEGLYCTEYGVSNAYALADIKLTFNEFSRYPNKGRIVVFEWNECIVGYAILVFFWSNEYCSDLIEIDEIFVDGDKRNLGIGTKFFAWLQAEYKTAAGFSLQVNHDNKAQSLYERQGFRLSHRKHLFKLLKTTK